MAPEQIEALQLLLSGKTEAETAKAIGKSRTTISRWKKLPEFQEALSRTKDEINETRMQIASDIASRMERLATKGMDALEAILDNPDTPTREKLEAIAIAGRWTGLENRNHRRRKASIKMR